MRAPLPLAIAAVALLAAGRAEAAAVTPGPVAAPASPAHSSVQRVFERIPHGDSYRRTSPWRSFGYPRLYYYPYGLKPPRLWWLPRWKHHYYGTSS